MSTATSTNTETDEIYVGRAFAFISDPATRITEGYDELRVFKIKRNGTEVEITSSTSNLPEKQRIPLVSDKCNYTLVDTNAQVGEQYRFEIHDDANVLPPVVLNTVDAVDTEYEAVMSIDELKRIYLFGIDLTDDEGRPFPDILFAHYIKFAIERLQTELDLWLQPTKITESYDFYQRDYQNYGFIQLRSRPVISVASYKIEYPTGDDVVDFPVEWIRLDRHAGHIQVLPASGTINQLLVSAGGGFLPLVFGGADFIPDILKVTYTAGFELGPRTTRNQWGLPQDLKEAVGLWAATGPFNTAGDLIVGAGIAQRSLSIDGLSESVATTSSATNAGFGSRLVQYEKQMKALLPRLMQKYKGARLHVV